MTAFSNVLQKFINRSPVTVMVQGLLEQILNEEKLNIWFEANRGRQYTGELLFSTVVALMLEVVCQMRASVHVAYRNTENITVSVASLYNKLNGMKTETSAILIMKSSGRRNRYFKTFEHKFEHLSPIVKANISS